MDKELTFKILSKGARAPFELRLCEILNAGMPLEQIDPDRGFAASYQNGFLSVQLNGDERQNYRAVKEVKRTVREAGLRLIPEQAYFVPTVYV